MAKGKKKLKSQSNERRFFFVGANGKQAQAEREDWLKRHRSVS